MVNDRMISISVGGHRRSVNWQPQSLMLSEMYERLRMPARGTETMQQYLSMKKSGQDDLKDVGGFVAGSLSGPRRKAGSVTGRDLITLDLDNIPPGGTEEILRHVEGLGCGYCVYSTRKHSPAAPRLRLLIPLDRAAAADEYEPLARKAAQIIGMEYADPTTFDVARLMYWPSVCSDGEYIYACQDKPMMSADGMLALFDWKDVASWPRHVGEVPHARLAAKQGDPLTKNGVVGAFCRVYDVPAAMGAFLPGVYGPSAAAPGRYTYAHGSTEGGAVMYDNGKFLFSHHATDPCHGRLVNAFDLVRLHRFGGLDDASEHGTPANRLPSYTEMCALAVADRDVSALMDKERIEAGKSDFEGLIVEGSEAEDSGEWLSKLTRNSRTGKIAPTIDNVRAILENDPLLRGKFALNEFSWSDEVLGALPWERSGKRRLWGDNDNQGAYWYLEKVYQITGNVKIDSALSLHKVKHSFNEVRDYLEGLEWDGTPRLDTLFIDYLGAEDSGYTRAVTRKAFTAAVYRAMRPGYKFDNMIILSGRQGIGKSTLLDKMSRGWFNDSIRTFEGKEASELLQGVWLVEISELDAFRKSDVSRIKQFLSLRADRFRAAYGRHVKEMPRQCVFFGTTNTDEYLRDETGNRRFWPVSVGRSEPSKSVWAGLDNEINQLWAEAFALFKAGEPLCLPKEIEDAAKWEQETHREFNMSEGVIIEFLEEKVPDDWPKWKLDRRKLFWSGALLDDINLKQRDKICALEIWCEAFDGALKELRHADALKINATINRTGNWTKSLKPQRFGYCGVQRGFERNS